MLPSRAGFLELGHHWTIGTSDTVLQCCGSAFWPNSDPGSAFWPKSDSGFNCYATFDVYETNAERNQKHLLEDLMLEDAFGDSWTNGLDEEAIHQYYYFWQPSSVGLEKTPGFFEKKNSTHLGFWVF